MTILTLKPYVKELNLLIVEDDDDTRKTLQIIFSRLFKTVNTACNGEEGFAMFLKDEHFYDMIFTDVTMPIMNGIQMIEKIRHHNKAVPIVVLSAHNDSQNLIEIINAGADTFLSKPFTPDQKLNTLYRLAIRTTDSKLLAGYIDQIEQQNIALAKNEESLKKVHRALEMKIWELNNKLTLHEKQDKSSSNETTTPIEAVKIAKSADHSDYYHQLVQEDIHELIDLVDEIENYVLLTFQGAAINESYIDQLATSFHKFGSILYRFPVFGNLGSAIFGLSAGIAEQKSAFVSKQEFVLPFLENLIFVLHKYVDDIWKKPAKNPHFYDASIINDIGTFLSIVKGEEEAVAEAEDLLEFF